MGRLLISLGREDGGLRVAGAVEAAGHPRIGEDAGVVAGGAALGVSIVGDLKGILRAEHVVLDFTGVPDVAVRHAALSVERGAALVVGTTGFDARQREELSALATRTRSVVAATRSRTNTSHDRFVSPATRFDACEEKATKRPSALIAAWRLQPSACAPVLVTLTRSVVPM